MHDQKLPEAFRNKRERYQMTPDRYSEVVSIPQIRKTFTIMGRHWQKNRKYIKYIDLGCGDCKGTRTFKTFIEGFTTLPVRSIGIDASVKCSQQCKEKGIDFIRLDLGLERIPFEDCQVMTLFETIEHVFDTDFLLESIRNSISQDGMLLVTTLNVVCWKNRILVPLGLQPFNTEVSTRKLSYGYRSKYLKKRFDAWKPAGHIRPFTLYSLRDMLEDNGFKVVCSFGLENWKAFKFLEVLAKNMCTGILIVVTPS